MWGGDGCGTSGEETNDRTEGIFISTCVEAGGDDCSVEIWDRIMDLVKINILRHRETNQPQWLPCRIRLFIVWRWEGAIDTR